MDVKDTLQEQLVFLAESEPDKILVTLIADGGATKISARELVDKSRAYADLLRQKGVQVGDVVILVLQHSEALIYAFWGAILAGAIPSIFPFLTDKLDAKLYEERVAEVVHNSGAKIVISYPPFSDSLGRLLGKVDCDVLAVDELKEIDSAELDLPKIEAEQITLLQHSSGTTGLQKGVALSNQAVIDHLNAYGKAIALDAKQDVIVSWLPLYHDMGLIAGFVMPIISGTPLVLVSPFEWIAKPEMIVELIAEYGGTLCWMPNFAYNLLAKVAKIRLDSDLDISTLRAFINCSEPVRADSHQALVESMQSFGLARENLASCYAMAENTFAVTQSTIGEEVRIDRVHTQKLQEEQMAVAITSDDEESESVFVSCGRPITGVDLRILGENAEVLAERHVGEIALKSSFLLSEYHNSEELTKLAFTDEGYFLTGDIGYLADGELYISGRKKDLIIVGGKNIFPQDIENLANDIDGIYPGRAVVFGLFDERIGSEKVALLYENSQDEYKKDSDLIESEVRKKIVEETEITLAVVRQVPRGWIVKTSSGKLARKDNRIKFLNL